MKSKVKNTQERTVPVRLAVQRGPPAPIRAVTPSKELVAETKEASRKRPRAVTPLADDSDYVSAAPTLALFPARSKL